MSTEITKQELLPESLAEITGLSKAFVASGYFTDVKQLSQAIVKIQAGKELGLPPVYSMQNINLIRGRLTSSANTMAMLVKRSGRYDYQVKEHDDQHCSIDFSQLINGKWETIGNSTFTIADAKRADLVKPDSGWLKYPRAMLFSRAISQGARIYTPDAIGGMYTDEEIRSIPARPDDETIVNIIDEPSPQPDQGVVPPAGVPPSKPGQGQDASKNYPDTKISHTMPIKHAPAPVAGEKRESQTAPKINATAPVSVGVVVDTAPDKTEAALKKELTNRVIENAAEVVNEAIVKEAVLKLEQWDKIRDLTRQGVVTPHFVAKAFGKIIEEFREPALFETLKTISLDALVAFREKWGK